MESFSVAISAVMPFLIYISFGYLAVQKQVVDEVFLGRLNKMVFRLFFPFMTFYNIYKADANSLPQPKLLIFAAISLLLLEGVLILIVPRFVKENPRRGVVIQGIYRSNFVLFGIPLTVAVFGDAATSIAAMMVTVVITIYNTTSVVILEMFNGEKKTGAKELLRNVAVNPLLQGAVVGILFFVLQIKLPECIIKPVAAFSDMTSPLALFILGGTLHFDAIAKNARCLVSVLTLKLFAVPAIMMALAYMIGLRGVELFVVLAMYGTPIATASYPMAQNMGGDGELAGQLVVISTVASVVTLFIWIFVLTSIGLIA